MSALVNDRDLTLQATGFRTKTTALSISGSSSSFKTPKNGAATVPSVLTLTAVPSPIYTNNAVFTWHYALSTSPNTWELLATGSTLNLSSSNFLTILGSTALSLSIRCTATESLLDTSYAFFTIDYSKEASDPIVVDISRVAAVIPCDYSGTPKANAFNNTDTTISVFRGAQLAYSSIGAPNTFKVTIQDTAGRVLGPPSNTSTSFTLSGITAISADYAKVVFVITIYDASGNPESVTIGKEIGYSKITDGLVGGDASYYYIDTTTDIVVKSTASASIPGTHTNFTATAKRIVGNGTPTNYGFLTLTGNADVEATTAVNSITTNINNTAGKTSYTVKMYNIANVASAILLDTQIVPVIFSGASAVNVVLTNSTTNIPTNSAGTAGIYSNSGTNILVYEGTTALTYNGAGTTPGTWKIQSITASSITAGTASTLNSTTAAISVASNIVASTATISYVIAGTTLAGVPFTTPSYAQTFSRSLAGAAGADSIVPGPSGSKSITINAYRWLLTAPPVPTQAFNYVWGTGPSAYPTGYTASAPASPGTGYSLYQLSLTITEANASAASTSSNWSGSIINTVGYTEKGSNGVQGNSARTAYIVTTSSTAPTPPTPAAGDAPPTNWSFSAISTLTSGQYMYQVDGILAFGGNITWGNPYLSTLKAGSLSVLSADLGTVGISNTGSLSTNSKTYGSGSGVFIGYSGSAYKFDVGSANSYLRFDGTTVIATGLAIKSPNGNSIFATGDGLSFAARFPNTTNMPAENATVGAVLGSNLKDADSTTVLTSNDIKNSALTSVISAAQQAAEDAHALASSVVSSRGSTSAYLSGYSVWSNAAANTYFTTAPFFSPIINDRLTQYDGLGFSETRVWDGNAWIKVSGIFDGSLVVVGTVTSDALSTNLVTVGQRIESVDKNFVIDLANKFISVSV